MTDFVYWAHKLPHGIEVAEICGGEDRSHALWKAMALQLFAEHSDDGWRQIEHYGNGAPFLVDEENRRVSITHTGRFMAIAMLPPCDKSLGPEFIPGQALGIDAEKTDRRQVLNVRDRFLNESEKNMVVEDDIEANVMAWTIKEAVYKAMLTPGLDFRKDIQIISFPDPKSKGKGEAIAIKEGHEVRLTLCSWISEGCLLTVAYG